MNESFHFINRLRELIAFFADDDRSEFMNWQIPQLLWMM